MKLITLGDPPMTGLTRFWHLAAALAAATLMATFAARNVAAAEPLEKDEGAGWISLFNGKDFTGWKISDNGLWNVEDGMIVANGPRSHLFTEKEFKNFEFKAEVMTTPGSNSGIYFHTKFQDTGWPEIGHESQVNVTHGDPVKTGSIYNIVKLYKTPAKDKEWWTQSVTVKGRNIVVKINGEVVVDYTEPEGAKGTRKLSSGSMALQAHDPKSVVYYRNLRIRPLAD
jgi:hypothetical protein